MKMGRDFGELSVKDLKNFCLEASEQDLLELEAHVVEQERWCEGVSDELIEKEKADILKVFDEEAICKDMCLNERHQESWSNAACIGYCLKAMEEAGLPEKWQLKVLHELWQTFDEVSVPDAVECGR